MLMKKKHFFQLQCFNNLSVLISTRGYFQFFPGSEKKSPKTFSSYLTNTVQENLLTSVHQGWSTE